MSADFVREHRYVVFKVKDICKYLDLDDRREVLRLSNKIDKGRCDEGKVPFTCVVVEEDWPEYETVWKMLEDRWIKELEDEAAD